MEADNVEQPEVVVEVKLKGLRVSLSVDEFPRVNKCCFVANLRIGLSIWLILEAIIWAFFFIAALYHEIVYADSIDLWEFTDESRGWYFYLIFGDEAIEMDQKKRTYIILFNLLLTLIFLTYLAFCLVLLLGINMRKTCFFLPYFVLDVVFSIIAFIGCIVGLLIYHNHLFRMCFLFVLIKAYVEVCVVSLFVKYRHDKSKTPTPIDTSGIVYEDNQATAV